MERKHISFELKTKAEFAIHVLMCCFLMNNIAYAQSNSTAGSGSASSLQEMYAAKYGSSSQNAGTRDGRRNSGTQPVINQTPPVNFNQTPSSFPSRPPIDTTYSAPKFNRMPTFNSTPVQTNTYKQTSTSSTAQLGGGDFPLPPAADEVEQFRIPQLDALIMRAAYRQNRIDGSMTPPPGYNNAQKNSRYK